MNSNGTLPETWKKNYYKGTREEGKAQIECPKERLLILNKAFLDLHVFVGDKNRRRVRR